MIPTERRMIPTEKRNVQRDDERGAVLILASLVMVSLLVTTALVIDLGYTRGGAGFRQSNADLSALAGGDALVRGRYEDACKDIVTYVNTNAQPDQEFAASSFCSSFSTTTCSSGGSADQAVSTATSGSYDLTISFPVPDSEIADPTFGAGNTDGLPCERMRVEVTSRQPSFFGGIVGRSGYSVTRSATVRGGASQTRLVPALWLLDPVGCDVLTVSGGSEVTAGNVSDPDRPIPGVIAVDSDGSDGCSTSKTTIDASNGTELRAVPLTGNARERGQISLKALPLDAETCAGTVACKQEQVGTGRQISPQPTGAPERATRAPIDWLWNCKASYPPYMGVPIAGCPLTNERKPYIDRLKSEIGTSGAPVGFTKFNDCKPSGHVEVPQGNWWVNCPGGLKISGGNGITFHGGNLVIDGGVKLLGDGFLNVNTNNTRPDMEFSCLPPSDSAPCINSSSAKASFIYVRKGDWELGGGTFNGNRTTVYLGDSSVVKGNGGPPKWTAPTQGPFAGLALWAEAPGDYDVSGGTEVMLQGTFFTPYADLSLTGGGNWGQQNAQFISYQLKVSGGSILNMAPDPTSSVSMPPPAATLIR